MSLFGSLKKTVNHINSEVSELKKVQPVFLFRPEVCDPAPNIVCKEPEEIEKQFSEMESLVKNIRVSASTFEAQFKKGQRITKNFCLDYDDFLLDVNADIMQVQNKLERSGYCPPNIVFPVEKEPVDPAENDDPKVTKSTTPKLMRRKSSSTPEIVFNKENNDKTPVLCLDPVPVVKLTSKKKSAQPIELPKSKSYQEFGVVARKLEF